MILFSFFLFWYWGDRIELVVGSVFVSFHVPVEVLWKYFQFFFRNSCFFWISRSAFSVYFRRWPLVRLHLLLFGLFPSSLITDTYKDQVLPLCYLVFVEFGISGEIIMVLYGCFVAYNACDWGYFDRILNIWEIRNQNRKWKFGLSYGLNKKHKTLNTIGTVTLDYQYWHFSSFAHRIQPSKWCCLSTSGRRKNITEKKKQNRPRLHIIAPIAPHKPKLLVLILDDSICITIWIVMINRQICIVIIKRQILMAPLASHSWEESIIAIS